MDFIINELSLISQYCPDGFVTRLELVLYRTVMEAEHSSPTGDLKALIESDSLINMMLYMPHPIVSFDYFARTNRIHLLKDFNPYFIKCFSDDTEEMNTAYLYFQLFLEESRTEHSERFMNAFFADVTDKHYFATEIIIKAFVKTLNRMPTSQELINFQPSNI